MPGSDEFREPFNRLRRAHSTRPLDSGVEHDGLPFFSSRQVDAKDGMFECQIADDQVVEMRRCETDAWNDAEFHVYAKTLHGFSFHVLEVQSLHGFERRCCETYQKYDDLSSIIVFFCFQFFVL